MPRSFRAARTMGRGTKKTERERGSKNPPSRVNNSAQRDWLDGNSRMDWPRENDCNFFSPGYSNAILIRCARATILNMKKKRRYRRRKELRSCAYYMYVYIIGKTRRRNFVYNAIRCARMQISRSERERERKEDAPSFSRFIRRGEVCLSPSQ